MPFDVRQISLWPVNEAFAPAIGAALRVAGARCPAGETWRAGVYEGPDLASGEMKVTLFGSHEKVTVWNDWQYRGEREGEHVYSRAFTYSPVNRTDTTWIQRELTEPVGYYRMLDAP